MAFKKLLKEDAVKMYQKGEAFSRLAATDSNDPYSYNQSVALNNYSAAILGLLGTAIDGINDLLERVDRIEQSLKATPRAGPR